MTRRRRKILLLRACGLIAVVAVCFFCLREKEPSYNGRTLSEWLRQYDKCDYSNPPNQIGMDEARTAVNAMGQSTIPVLLQWTHAQPSIIERSTPWILNLIPNGRLWEFLYKRSEAASADNRRLLAITGFEVLRTNAMSALPQLEAAFNAGTTRQDIIYAADSIEQLGEPGLDFLISSVRNPQTSQHRDLAIGAIGNMGYLGDKATKAVPPLLELLQSGSSDAKRVAWCLGALHLRPEVVVPALARGFQSQDAQTRVEIIIAFNAFGEDAKPAIPAIKAALKDSDDSVVQRAIETLSTIAPTSFADEISEAHKAVERRSARRYESSK